MNDDIHNQQHESVNEQSESSELVACKTERDVWKDKFLRVQADLDNFTKRSEKERLQWRTLAQSSLLVDLLPIIDDFDRAFEQAEKNQTDVQTWMTGFELIRKALYKFLAKHDVQEIAATVPFDPEYHEAIAQVDAPGKDAGVIVSILQKGYTFRGQVLRPAKVSVAK